MNFYVIEAKVLALQVDHVASPTTPREGLMMKPVRHSKNHKIVLNVFQVCVLIRSIIPSAVQVFPELS